MDILTNKHNGQTLNLPYCAADQYRGMVAAMRELAEFCESYLSTTQPLIGLLSDVAALSEPIEGGSPTDDQIEAWHELQGELGEEIAYRLEQLNPTKEILAYWDGERGGFFIEAKEDDIYDD